MRRLSTDQKVLLNMVTEASEENRSFKRAFAEEMCKLREVKSASVQDKLASAVQNAVNSGVSVAAVMEAYGTKDRATINKLINRQLPKTEHTDTINIERLTNGNLWVTLENYNVQTHGEVASGSLEITHDEYGFGIGEDPNNLYPLLFAEVTGTKSTGLRLAINEAFNGSSEEE